MEDWIATVLFSGGGITDFQLTSAVSERQLQQIISMTNKIERFIVIGLFIF
jgi:hypothetical protein